uniref:RNA-directed RNA polymerase C-terminal domain-containing protein n=1 Tax=viral metagenome TaxID=1070528 RepID=A0A2V0RIR3_9ZZZZ
MKNYAYNIYHSFSTGQLDLRKLVLTDELFTPLTGAFIRNQISDSGLKVRLVFAVSFGFIVIETFFNLIIKHYTKNHDCYAIHGFTQSQLRDLTMSLDKNFVLCIDYKSYDQNVPAFVISTCSMISAQIMGLSNYNFKIFKILVAYFITCPVFHPEVEYKVKRRGIPSGSGFTSLFGSLCNLYMLSVCVHRHCKNNNIRILSVQPKLIVSSDDTMISTTFDLDFKDISSLLKEIFDMNVEFESHSVRGESKVYFLGSRWENGNPTRNVNRMLARICFGNGNYPGMSAKQMFQSRCYEILGNTSQYSELYGSFNVPYPTRVFRSLELMDYNTRLLALEDMQGKEKRGVWQNVNLDRNSADFVYLSR